MGRPASESLQHGGDARRMSDELRRHVDLALNNRSVNVRTSPLRLGAVILLLYAVKLMWKTKPSNNMQ